MVKSFRFYIGIGIIIFIIATYFINITHATEDNLGRVMQTEERLLGILVFHNPFILSLYVLVAVVLVVYGKTTKGLKTFKGEIKHDKKNERRAK